jgi:hypothetical protein
MSPEIHTPTVSALSSPQIPARALVPAHALGQTDVQSHIRSDVERASIHEVPHFRVAAVQPWASLAHARQSIERVVEPLVASSGGFLMTMGALRAASALFMISASGIELAWFAKPGHGDPVSTGFHAGWVVIGAAIAGFAAYDLGAGIRTLYNRYTGSSLPHSRSHLLSMSQPTNKAFVAVGAVVVLLGAVGHSLLEDDLGRWNPVTPLTEVGTLFTIQGLACLYRSHVLDSAPGRELLAA